MQRGLSVGAITHVASTRDCEDCGSAGLCGSARATGRGTALVAECLLNTNPNEWLALSRLWGPSPRILQRPSERWSANSFNQPVAPEMLVNSDLAVTFQPLCTQIITPDCKGDSAGGGGGALLESQKDLVCLLLPGAPLKRFISVFASLLFKLTVSINVLFLNFILFF